MNLLTVQLYLTRLGGISLALACTACASGGGSFDVDKVQHNKTVLNPPAKFVDANAPKAGDLTEVGYTVTAPWGKNNAPASVYGHQQHAVNPGRADTDESKYNSVRFLADNSSAIEREASIKIIPKSGQDYAKGVWVQDNGVESDPNYDLMNFGKLSGSAYNAGNYDFSNHEITGDFLKQTAFDHTKVGVIALRDAVDDRVHSNIYYKGQNKTTDVPTAGEVNYKGTWEYVTHNRVSGTGVGINSGSKEYIVETSGNYENTATFKANFADKTLTGDLTAKDRFGSIKYDVDAKISHNGFSGTATKDTSATTLFENDANNTPLDAKATVSGSFYGSQAAELAGRLNGDANQIVGVFAAKTENTSGLETDGNLYQASALVLDKNDTDKTVSSQSEFQNINFSGDIKKLQIDGTVINLDSMASKSAMDCCKQFQAVSIGQYVRSDTTDPSKVTGLYLQGYLTPLSQMPTTGTANYRGSWFTYAYVGKDTADKIVFAGPARLDGAKVPMEANFAVDFAAKTVDGKLVDIIQTFDTPTPAISFHANIVGNGFATNDAQLNVRNAMHTLEDRDKTSDYKTVTGIGRVEGHFYGENANELGGTVMKDDRSFAAVFAGKQVAK